MTVTIEPLTHLVAYRDPTLSTEERVRDLLARMTTEEKIAQLGGVLFPTLLREGELERDAMNAALQHGIGHVSRLGTESRAQPHITAALANELQRMLVEHTRLGIPALIHEECVAGLCARGATQFPQAIALASSWDPDLLEAVARSCRRHLRAVGARVALAPVIDVARDPRWGRLEETYGEDPELTSRLAVAFVRGLQGDDLRTGVVATAKHFVAHGVPIAGFNQGSVSLGGRELRDVMAAPFRAAINEAGLAGVMSAYHDIDGVPCSASRELLTTLLRDDLGFDGVVVADYWAVSHLETVHHVAADATDSARQALEAGVDVELPQLDRYHHLHEPAIDIALVERAVRRVLRQKIELGLFEAPYVDADAAGAAFDSTQDRALARVAACRSLVLLTNDGTLPLCASSLRRVVVLGASADDERVLLGDYNYPVHVEGLAAADAPSAPSFHAVPIVTPLAGLRAALPAAEVVHVVGAPLTGPGTDGDIADAVDAARHADVAVVFVGGLSGVVPAATSGELRDAAHLELSAAQRRLIAEVAAVGTPTVVVVISGRAHALVDVAEAANAVVMAWVPGEEGGNAIADVLTGAVSPAGRLPVSLLRTAGQVGVISSARRGGGRSQLWGDYVDEPCAPLFGFGHGLSYAAFTYDDIDVVARSTEAVMFVGVTVTNTSAIVADEVVQLYVRDEVASVAQPERRLLAFARAAFQPGERRRIVFEVPAGRLGFTGRDGRTVVEPGAFTFLVGASRDDIRLRSTAELTGKAVHPDPNTIPPSRSISYNLAAAAG